MTSMSLIVEHLDALLDPGAYDDYGPNGLQVPGRDEVATVVTGVSANVELVRARARSGRRPRPRPPRPVLGRPAAPARPRRQAPPPAAVRRRHGARRLPPAARRPPRASATTRCSPTAIGCESRAPFAAHKRATIGVAGALPGDGIAPDELVARVRAATGREPLAFTDGPERVRTVGIVSGAGADYLEDAIAAGLDAFVTGEPIERAMARAREAEVHFVAAGHYATETFGVRRLGDLLGRALRRRATSSSTCRTRSERARQRRHRTQTCTERPFG